MGRLFAISDIHGCFKPFYELVVNTIKLRKSDQLILLGDYIDRGEQSREVIDFILDLEKDGFNISTLTGNHEVMLLNSYYNQDDLPLWMMNSGVTTLMSFGIENICDLDKRYLEFFTTLEYFKILGDIVFVHAGFDDDAPDPFSDRHTMVWECSISYKHPLLSGKTVVHGHRPKTHESVRKLISEKSRVIPIDTGCVYNGSNGYGFLSALELKSMALYSVANL